MHSNSFYWISWKYSSHRLGIKTGGPQQPVYIHATRSNTKRSYKVISAMFNKGQGATSQNLNWIMSWKKFRDLWWFLISPRGLYKILKYALPNSLMTSFLLRGIRRLRRPAIPLLLTNKWGTTSCWSRTTQESHFASLKQMVSFPNSTPIRKQIGGRKLELKNFHLLGAYKRSSL